MLRKTLVQLFLLFHFLEIGASQCIGGYCYNSDADIWLKFHEIPSTWRDAKISCRNEGAILASPLTEEIKNAILSYLSYHTHAVVTIFTGVHSTYSKGAYTSIEGVPLSKLAINWAPAEPNNYKNSEGCLVMLHGDERINGTMGDVDCDSVYPYVCYKEMERNQTVVNKCGTADPEYHYEECTNKCYKFHRYGRTWPNAYRTCHGEGGHLAIINDQKEFHFIKDLMNNNPGNVVFADHKEFIALGFSDPNDGDSWITVHGQTLKEAGFEGWASGEPNNASQPNGELCGVAYRDNGLLYDAPCWWSLAFICEKEPYIFKNYHILS